MLPIKVLITGGSGKLGQYLNIELSKSFDILSLYNNNIGNSSDFNHIKGDIRNYEELKKVFEVFHPSIVVHTAAVSNPLLHGSEYDKHVYDINVRGTENIARLSELHVAKLIYTSTDLVYAGYRGSFLTEDAKLIPVSLYAETKLMGENKIQSITGNYIILRTALLFGFGLNHCSTHFDQLHNNLKEGRESKLFTDQIRTPLSLPEAARIIRELCMTEVNGEIVNFGGINRVSRFEMGKILCKLIKGNERLLIPALMSDLPDYPAVADVSLDTNKLQSYGIKQPDIEEAIRQILNSKK
ncbi:MAG: NAD(P)-dependent oxidoreductase [Ignavibacteriaceae bacterium]